MEVIKAIKEAVKSNMLAYGVISLDLLKFLMDGGRNLNKI